MAYQHTFTYAPIQNMVCVWMKHFHNLLIFIIKFTWREFSKICNMHECIRSCFANALSVHFNHASNPKKKKKKLIPIRDVVECVWYSLMISFSFFFFLAQLKFVHFVHDICFIHFDFGFIVTLLRMSIYIFIFKCLGVQELLIV